MGSKTENWILGVPAVLTFAAMAIVSPCQASEHWVAVSSEAGKRVEINRESIVTNASGEAMARGRIVLDKPIVDPRTSGSYRMIEITNRYDCNERTHATLKRSYLKENGEVLRQEEVRIPYDTPVRSGTPDDRLFREACRPKGVATANPSSASQTLEKVNEMAAQLRQHNEAMVEKEVRKDTKRLSVKAHATLAGKVGPGVRAERSGTSPIAAPPVAWSYEGAGGPENWGKIRPEYALCSSGLRQSPIDIRDGFAVDLEAIHFAYKPSPFKVVDGGKNLLVMSYGSSLSLLGKNYVLTQILFHRPAEMTVAGKVFDMDVQLFHRGEDGKRVIVSIPLERGAENPVIQTVLNNLPLERSGEVEPPMQSLDIERLLPDNRAYHAFMGSLTTPPCTEDVLWLVLKSSQPISLEQLAIFQRLYPPNARPVQPVGGRIIKESR